MEPLSALSIATAVVQFLDFAGTLVSGTWEISRSSFGDTEKNSDLRYITESLQKHNEELRNCLNQSNVAPFSSQDRDIEQLCRQCNEVADRLVTILNRIRSNSKDSKWNSFRAALRTMWSQEEVDTLQKTLDSYRQQISMLILVSMREQINTNYGQTSTTLQNTQDLCLQVLKKLDKTQQFQDDVINAIKLSYGNGHSFAGTATSTRATNIHGVLRPDQVEDINRQVLISLQFREMENRYEQISQAYQQTFQWIFRPSTPGTRWTNFPQWIKGDDGLYWITGKAGAGKSTLMKFIYDHPKTKEALTDWAGDDRLVMASFFFWNSDTAIQMSLEGLIKSILYQVLIQMPELIPVVFPHRVEAGVMFGYHVWNFVPWSWTELLKGFEILVSEATQKAKLILFIDGMDEFDGQPADLVDFIQKAVRRRIKLCVSSRPWIAFEDAFRNRPHLQLEDLTFNDIKVYVTSKMNENPGYKVLQKYEPELSIELIDNITAKASGVFLWVYIVTASLLRGLSEGERISDLQRRLDALPHDLESLFSKILDTLSPEHYKRAAQLFQIVRTSITPIFLLYLSFADEDDPHYAAKQPLGALSRSQAFGRAEFMRRRLTANCRGLLEIHARDGYALPSVHVTFLHRTVKDFLEGPDIKSKMGKAVGDGFNPNLRLCNAEIMRLKTRKPETLRDQDFWTTVMYGIEYAVRADPECTSYQRALLHELDSVATKLTTTKFGPQDKTFLQQRGHRRQSAYWTCLRGEFRRASSLLAFAVLCQLEHYVRTTLLRISKGGTLNPLLLSQLLHLAVVDYRIYIKDPANPVHEDERLAMHRTQPSSKLIAFLLELGANPNERFGDCLTAWEAVIADSYFGYDEIGTFLRHGANPRVYGVDVKCSARAELVALLKQKKRETRWEYYSGRFGLHRD